MRRKTIKALAAVLIVLIWTVCPFGRTGPSFAARQHERAGEITVMPFAGASIFEGGDHDDGPVAGLGLGYALTDRVQIEGSLAGIFTETDPGGDTLGWLYRLEGIYDLTVNGRLVPFIAGGIGGLTYDYDEGGSDTSLLFDWGGGVKYYLTERMAIRGDLRHVIMTESDPRNILLATVGLSFSFGGPARDVQPTVAVEAFDGAQQVEPAPAVPGEPLVTDRIPDEETLTRDVCLILSVHFEFDRTSIRPEDEETLREVAEFIKAHPEIGSAEIRGHTDDVGTVSYNQDLSLRRAESVRRHLAEVHGIDPGFFEIKGFGMDQPSALNLTEEGRAQNRRAVTVTCRVREDQAR
jgi:OmpA-OmpF porin, OOP family